MDHTDNGVPAPSLQPCTASLHQQWFFVERSWCHPRVPKDEAFLSDSLNSAFCPLLWIMQRLKTRRMPHAEILFSSCPLGKSLRRDSSASTFLHAEATRQLAWTLQDSEHSSVPTLSPRGRQCSSAASSFQRLVGKRKWDFIGNRFFPPAFYFCSSFTRITPQIRDLVHLLSSITEPLLKGQIYFVAFGV